MPQYTYDIIETRQYRLTVESPDEPDAFQTVEDNYYNGLYDEELDAHPCGMEIYLVKQEEEGR